MKRKATDFHDNSQNSKHLLWVDIETTGDDPEKDRILEIGCILTDKDLTHISPCFQAYVQSPMKEILKLNPKLKNLATECSQSPYTLDNIENALIRFIKDRHSSEVLWTLAGANLSINMMFLNKYLPKFTFHLFSRVVNIDTLRELCWRWKPNTYARAPMRKKDSRLIERLPKAIDELRWYRENLFTRRLTLTGPRKLSI